MPYYIDQETLAAIYDKLWAYERAGWLDRIFIRWDLVCRLRAKIKLQTKVDMVPSQKFYWGNDPYAFRWWEHCHADPAMPTEHDRLYTDIREHKDSFKW